MGIQIKTGGVPPVVQSIATPELVPAKLPEAVKAAVKGSGELDALLKHITKEKGAKIVMKASEIPDVNRIATGIFEFDLATGGGFPEGRLSIVYGPESSGKTNACLCAVAQVQKRPGPCNKAVWIDLEHVFDPEWAARMGVDVDALIVVKPGYGEEAADIFDALVRADDVALVILDSIAHVVAAKEVDQSMEKFDVGTSALLVKRLCNKLAIAFAIEARRGHFPAVVFVNQTRYKIGVMFGDPETMPGGNTMKFVASLIVRLYGKNRIEKTVHPSIPAFKDTNAVIKKAKVPIAQIEFKYELAMLASDTLAVGQTDSWGTVSTHLKAIGSLVKLPNGWMLQDVKYPTLVPIQQQYQNDADFRADLQAIVITSFFTKKQLLETTLT